jgi:4-diphosphocytidyl-2-C-methyl-D-erythritol kinase
VVERAPGKVNLCLFLGPPRADGRHELVTVFESVSLYDDVSVSVFEGASDAVGGGSDEVVCAGVRGPNLALDALTQLRARGWEAPPVRVEIVKRIPVAAGMGGGSADAAAVLRLAAGIAPVDPDVLRDVAASLGADVPAMVLGSVSLGTGAGDVVEPLAPPGPHALALAPLPSGLSTAAVYREADRLGLSRPPAELDAALARLRSGAPAEYVNDLEPAARSLCPAIDHALDALRDAGAAHVFVCGSGPTCAGLWWGGRALRDAERAASSLVGHYPGATAVVPVPAIGHNSPSFR